MLRHSKEFVPAIQALPTIVNVLRLSSYTPISVGVSHKPLEQNEAERGIVPPCIHVSY